MLAVEGQKCRQSIFGQPRQQHLYEVIYNPQHARSKYHTCNPCKQELRRNSQSNKLRGVFLFIFTTGSRDVNEARGGLVLAVGRVRSKKNKSRKKKHEKIHPTQNPPRKPQQPGDRDHLETAREKTRPTR